MMTPTRPQPESARAAGRTPARPVFPRRVVGLEAARLRWGPRADRLCEMLWRVDPLADRLVAAFDTLPPGEGWRRVETMLARVAAEPALAAGVESEALPELSDLVRDVARPPLWVSSQIVDRGGELLHRCGPVSGLLLALASLVYGYASPGGNKPLVFAGGLTARASRRLNETSRFVHAVCSPGGMWPGGDGWQIALKVRVMHASVRKLLWQRDPASGRRWDAAAWGEPVNQHDMVATTQLFSTVLVGALETIGFRPQAEETERYMQLWRWVGRVMGVEPEVLPATWTEGYDLSELIFATQGAPDADSRALVRALFEAGPRDAPDAETRARMERQVPAVMGLCRALIGDVLADGLGLPDTRWTAVIHPLRAVVGTMETIVRAVPGGRERALESGRRHWSRSVEAGLAGVEATFAPLDRLLGHTLSRA